jgi:hypothetical protein
MEIRWKAWGAAWIRHAVPLDGDPGGAFRPDEGLPRKPFRRAGRLEPDGRICRIGIAPRSFEELGAGTPPPAA